MIELPQALNSEQVKIFSIKIIENSDNYLKSSEALKDIKIRNLLTSYRMLFEHSKNAALFIDLKGNILDSNTAATKLYGYTREELGKMKIYDIRAEKTWGLIYEQMQEAKENGIIFETYHNRKNGESFPVDVFSHHFVNKTRYFKPSGNPLFND